MTFFYQYVHHLGLLSFCLTSLKIDQIYRAISNNNSLSKWRICKHVIDISYMRCIYFLLTLISINIGQLQFSFTHQKER